METGVGILYGYPEKVNKTAQGSIYYNSAQLINNSGQSILNHRKVHLWIDHGWEKVFTPAERFSEVVDFCGFKIGVLICFDVEFPESVRTLVLGGGANLILVPTAVCDNSMRQLCRYIIPARAYENKVSVAYVNNAGYEFDGCSVCCGEDGDAIVAAGEGEEFLLANVVASGIEGNHVRNRRPELYTK